MGEKTAVEAKAANIVLMGDALGSVYSGLWQEVAWIHINWAHYRELFGTKPSRIDLLNSVSPSFFRTVQNCLFEAVLMHLARLTDPARSFGKTNLSLRHLSELTASGPVGERVAELTLKAVHATEFARDWRNRKLAHRDLDLALDQPVEPLALASRLAVKDALSAIGAVLNAVSAHYCDSTSMFDFDGGNDSVGLLYAIRDGLRAQDQRQVRIESGAFTEEEIKHEDI